MTTTKGKGTDIAANAEALRAEDEDVDTIARRHQKETAEAVSEFLVEALLRLPEDAFHEWLGLTAGAGEVTIDFTPIYLELEDRRGYLLPPRSPFAVL